MQKPITASKRSFFRVNRAVVNVRWVVGKGKILPMTTLKKAILLKRDPEDNAIVSKLSLEEATRYIETVDFCNPHMLVKDERKMNLRRQFFKELFTPLEIHVVNTTAPILEAHQAIKEIFGNVNQFLCRRKQGEKTRRGNSGR